ncbi:N-acetylmuramoyl-L-alanine amidase [Actinacidiphila glaucinigra]|uniref:peptidoglycan recognition protein family protein n=1 Tax=Actinacidiphila glaucinigra TaxID=235986 RepID=UPI0033B5ED3C
MRRIRLRGRAWLAIGAVVLGGAGVITAASVASGPEGTASSAASKGPVKTKVDALALKGTGGERELPQQRTDAFGTLGVTWDDPKEELDGTVQLRVRTQKTGKWSDWFGIETHNDDAPDAGAESAGRGGTPPLWVGWSDGVQARVRSDKGAAGLPKGMKLTLVGESDKKSSVDVAMAPAAFAVDAEDTASPSADPTATSSPPSETTEPATTEPSTTEPSATESSAPASTAPASSSPPATSSPTASASTPPTSTVAKPPIVTRAGWGADESMREQTEPDYAPNGVQVVFVHHTATYNATTKSGDYSCSSSPSIIRQIYAYHVSQTWRDIGYNFLVDKCGTIYEGRYGGVDRPVVGAQTEGYNTGTAGIAVIGYFQTDKYVSKATPMTPQMLGSVSALATWKLGLKKIDPNPGTKSQTVNGKAFYPISGHRDGFATECPGTELYAKVPTIRTYASAVAAPTLNGVSGATLSGTSYYTKGTATVAWKESTPTAVIKRFEVLVDGKVAATAKATATSAPITVAAGRHTVTVRAVHMSDKTATSASSYSVVGDTTKPTFTTAPSVKIRNATVSSTSVPVSVTWKAADTGALKSVAATAPSTATFGPTTTSWSTTGKVNTAVTYGLKATDAAGNYTTASVSRTAAILQETSATKSGTWSTKSSTSYLGGKSYTSSSKNASLTWTFTGRSVGWVVSRASTSGQAYVYVDGVKTATVDLKTSTTAYRQTIWSKSWSTSAKHTLKIVVVGTSGRPTITTDGITYVK